MLRPPPRPTLFPYTTLFRSRARRLGEGREAPRRRPKRRARALDQRERGPPAQGHDRDDPQSLRSEEHSLNSSHTVISYAVFCLKKKKKTQFAIHTSPIRLRA